ncbi:MAG: sensor histidine kinase [Adhaeribacter sp.]
MTTTTIHPSFLSLQRNFYLGLHLTVWASMAFLVLLLQPFSWLGPVSGRYWLLQCLVFCLFLALYYVNAYVWVPRVLFRDQTLAFAFLALGSGLAAFTGAAWLSATLGLEEMMSRTLYPGLRHALLSDGVQVFGAPVFSGMAILVLLASTCAAFVQRRHRDSQIRQALESQQMSAELAFLKARLNPHLFFKTLNHIYRHTPADGAQAREAVYALARLMRYMLYETAAGTTYLSKETEFLQDYIDLAMASLNSKVVVSFEKPIFRQDLEMAPMLLVPFVENAFSHAGISGKAARVFIGISQTEGVVDFTVRHTLAVKTTPERQPDRNLALADIRRRLEMLYPGRFRLTTTEHSPEQELEVRLRLELGK